MMIPTMGPAVVSKTGAASLIQPRAGLCVSRNAFQLLGDVLERATATVTWDHAMRAECAALRDNFLRLASWARRLRTLDVPVQQDLVDLVV